MSEALPSEEFSESITTKFGFMMIKPDAVKLGITEDIIAHITKYLCDNNIGELKSAFIVENLSSDQIDKVYPDLPEDGLEIVKNYLSEDYCVLVIFEGKETQNMLEVMKKLKGPRMMDWSLDQLNGNRGLDTSIRSILPVPGTLHEYAKVIDKVKLKKSDPSIRLTTEEFQIYCRNLVHSPDNISELLGLLGLLSFQDLTDLFGSEISGIIWKANT